MRKSIEFWEEVYANKKQERPTYDLWLDKFSKVLEDSKKSTIIDLGCGAGNDSLYLEERGYKVLACDQSETALEIVKKNIPIINVLKVDISKKLPFNDESTEVIVADLSLHYFDDKTTKKIVNELWRTLKNDGHLIFRVNSINDINYGAKQGSEIEKHYYFSKDSFNDAFKRFFDRSDIEYYFSKWQIRYCSESSINRFGNEKKVYEVLCTKKAD